MVFDHANESYTVYILRCRDGSYYVGSTNNLQERLQRHERGDAAQWTAQRLPVKLVYVETQETEVLARRREIQIKGWARSKKERLISGEWKKQILPP